MADGRMEMYFFKRGNTDIFTNLAVVVVDVAIVNLLRNATHQSISASSSSHCSLAVTFN